MLLIKWWYFLYQITKYILWKSNFDIWWMFYKCLSKYKFLMKENLFLMVDRLHFHDKHFIWLRYYLYCSFKTELGCFRKLELENKSRSEAFLHLRIMQHLQKTKTYEKASFTSTRFGMITQTPFINIIFCNDIQREKLNKHNFANGVS